MGSERVYSVLHIVHALNIGGMERWIVQFCLWLKHRGHQCSVVCLRETGKLASTLQNEDIEVIHIALTPGFSSIYPLQLLRYIRKARPDVIHAHSGVWYKSALASYFTGVPLVCTQHGAFEPGRRDWRTNISVRCARSVVAVSYDVLNNLRSAFPKQVDKLHFIPNGIADTLSDDTSKCDETWLADEGAVVGMVARFEPPKDYHTMVEAAVKVHQAYPGAQFVLVGEGPQQLEIQQKVSSLGAERYIHLLGARSDVPCILRRLRVFVLSSLSEGMPISVIEAMSAQRPIVATDVGGNPILLDGGKCGILVPPRDPRALAEAILELLTNQEKAQQLARNARQRFLEHFTIDAMGKRYLEVYQQAIEEFRKTL